MLLMDEIYREHSQTVYRYLLSLTRDGALAEELTQETFYQAVKSAGRFDGTCKISTWLCAIAKNVLYAHRRKHPPSEPLDESLPSFDTAEQTVIRELGQVELLKRMQILEPDARETVYLRALGGLSFRQIGDVLGKTENWARVTYYRAKEKLKKELGDNE